eukprot:TRINITY_DN12895_c0_g2_i1.p1 TRINITY_DN12895_c0_g2~~TRINITY_DN12895_c0_g2_i1.p1  ORF type:complete len:209 (+),score=14.85 TRINITY_DN12895_c0_g2_i1:25-651(+)
MWRCVPRIVCSSCHSRRWLSGSKVDPYKVLGVTRKTEPSVIKAKYRQLAKQYHPDTATGDVAKFTAVRKAWEAIESGAASEEPAPTADTTTQQTTQQQVKKRKSTADVMHFTGPYDAKGAAATIEGKRYINDWPDIHYTRFRVWAQEAFQNKEEYEIYLSHVYDWKESWLLKLLMKVFLGILVAVYLGLQAWGLGWIGEASKGDGRVW